MSLPAQRGAADQPAHPRNPETDRLFNSRSARFLTAVGVSLYGDWLSTVALVVLLFRITGSAAAPAIYILVRNAPRLLGSIPSGVLTDRAGPALVATAGTALQAVLTALIVVFARDGLVWPIYLAVALSQFLFGVGQPAIGSLIPRLASRRHLPRLNGLNTALQASAILVAPAIGALLLVRLSPETLIAIDAASFVIASVLLLSLRRLPAAVTPASPVRGAVAGVRIVARSPVLRALVLGYLGNAAVVTGLQAVLVVAASQRFGGDTTVGWLYAAVGAGALVGSAVMLRRAPSDIQRSAIIGGTILELAPLALFTFATNLAAAVVLLFLSSLGAVFYQTQGAIGMQERVQSDALGRVNAVVRFGQYLGMLIGGLVAVSVVQRLGWPQTVRILALFAAVLILLATFIPLSSLRRSSPA